MDHGLETWIYSNDQKHRRKRSAGPLSDEDPNIDSDRSEPTSNPRSHRAKRQTAAPNVETAFPTHTLCSCESKLRCDRNFRQSNVDSSTVGRCVCPFIPGTAQWEGCQR